jgi:hypothetical protein
MSDQERNSREATSDQERFDIAFRNGELSKVRYGPEDKENLELALKIALWASPHLEGWVTIQPGGAAEFTVRRKGT